MAEIVPRTTPSREGVEAARVAWYGFQYRIVGTGKGGHKVYEEFLPYYFFFATYDMLFTRLVAVCAPDDDVLVVFKEYDSVSVYKCARGGLFSYIATKKQNAEIERVRRTIVDATHT